MTLTKVLVCGSRDYTDYAYICEALDTLYAAYKFDVLIHGDCGKRNSRGVAYEGVDALAGRWAIDRGVQQVAVPANWTGQGNAAGMKRNQLMYDLLKPHLVIAFPGGPGTAGMMRIALEGGTPVVDVEEDDFGTDTEYFLSELLTKSAE